MSTLDGIPICKVHVTMPAVNPLTFSPNKEPYYTLQLLANEAENKELKLMLGTLLAVTEINEAEYAAEILYLWNKAEAAEKVEFEGRQRVADYRNVIQLCHDALTRAGVETEEYVEGDECDEFGEPHCEARPLPLLARVKIAIEAKGKADQIERLKAALKAEQAASHELYTRSSQAIIGLQNQLAESRVRVAELGRERAKAVVLDALSSESDLEAQDTERAKDSAHFHAWYVSGTSKPPKYPDPEYIWCAAMHQGRKQSAEKLAYAQARIAELEESKKNAEIECGLQMLDASDQRARVAVLEKALEAVK